MKAAIYMAEASIKAGTTKKSQTHKATGEDHKLWRA